MNKQAKRERILDFFSPLNKKRAHVQLEHEEEPDKQEVSAAGSRPSIPSCTIVANPRQESTNLPITEAAACLTGLDSDPTGISLRLVEPGWTVALELEFGKGYFQSLESYVKEELAKHKVYPPTEHIFRAFNSCPFDKVKVVIIGQDPYHQPGQAMGLSFSVPRGVTIPSSLRNIFKEIKGDIPGYTVPKHGNLEAWASQGVLLLNAVLTVRHDSAASHSKRGWEKLTDQAIRTLSSTRDGIVFLLWGKFAQEKAKLIDGSRQHHVLVAPHPSGLSAHRGFFGCRHFSKANALLEAAEQQPIDWATHD